MVRSEAVEQAAPHQCAIAGVLNLIIVGSLYLTLKGRTRTPAPTLA